MRMRHLSVPRLLALAALLLAPAACIDYPVVSPNLSGFTVTGTVTNRTGAEIPPDARVLVAWMVSATSQDYSYIFGEGTLEDGGTAFRIEIDGAPPKLALNAGLLGVGLILVTTDQSIGTGGYPDTIAEEAILGAAGRYAVIYVDPLGGAAKVRVWAEKFSDGYGIGRGVDVEDGFDEFTPAAPGEVEIILDDLDAIDFVNWT